MEVFTEDKFCKYCEEKLGISLEEGLQCSECNKNVHLKCLKRGSVPGGLYGDVFFSFTCQECSSTEIEVFSRIKLSWLQVVVLVLYHLHYKSPGLARKGFFHWRHHIGKFIDKNWETLFTNECKKKKKWTGTVAGTLSHFSKYIFVSGNAVLNKPAVWALMYPKLTPLAISCIYSVMMLEKQHMKNQKLTLIPDDDLFHVTVRKCIDNEDFLQVLTDTQNVCETQDNSDDNDVVFDNAQIVKKMKRRKNCASQVSKKIKKLSNCESMLPSDLPGISSSTDFQEETEYRIISSTTNDATTVGEVAKYVDPMCYYNTSLTSFSRTKGLDMYLKLTGGIREIPIKSPFSGIHLPPYIFRDTDTFPPWLELLARIKLEANKKVENYILPPRGVVDFVYVQPDLIPALNNLCNQFFWPGIDLTETLKYPEYSCVVLYRRLIVGFAFMVPVKFKENYMPFIFTRPHWRNCGIGQFMIYHLMQVCMGKDITLHVPTDNPAIILFKKYGCQIENHVEGFYDKYLGVDMKKPKHAFFCRLSNDWPS
ncbi:cysteine-rich protein 2-binding protein isoform X1 [Leptinotarsa decemlineata]|uniref:cysteine-rich protein 2-binding protein isoform X1 n=1 Tax=Leptinotarsa decemlineata TaxID=7539 RepID=UPI003D303FCD